MASIRRCLLLVAVLLGTIGVVAPTADAATSMSVSWALPSNMSYGIGFDYVYSNGSSPGGYEKYYEWPYSLYNNNAVMPNPVSIYSATTLSQLRMEIYQAPNGEQWDSHDDAAVALRMNPTPYGQNLGNITFPQIGQANAARFVGDILSATPVTNGRVHIDMFQITGQAITNTGYVVDAFTSFNTVGTTYRSGPLWNGQYLAFITDNTTGRQAVGLVDLAGQTELDIDLDMVCFGIDECQWAGSIPNASGEFHAVAPTRIVDSRTGLGIPSKVTPGDGRNSDPNPFKRYDSKVNHEFKVAGVGGVPAVGVSAVLVNVTVTQGNTSGSLRLFPKPPRTYVFGDQTSFPASNSQTPAVFWNAGEARATLQLLEVGVGGRIRVDNISSGDVHLVIDVLGWVDQGQPGQDGSRLLTIDPTRFLDTRFGPSDPLDPFGPFETRALQVAGHSGIPGSAEAVVGTLTSVNADGKSFQTVWPDGGPMPLASVLNSLDSQIRPNLVSVAVGDGDAWAMYNYEHGTDLIFDAVGYFTTAQGGGGDITAVPSSVLFGPTTMTAGNDRSITVANRGGVPAAGTVKAVWVLINSTGGTQRSYLTAYPSGSTFPIASNLNWVAGQSVANLALVPVGADGAIRIYNAHGSATVTVSVLGWVN